MKRPYKKEWFSSDELVSFLETANEEDTVFVDNFFSSVLSFFKVDEKGDSLSSILTGEWGIFKTDDGIKPVLKHLKLDLKGDEKVVYNDKLSGCLLLWESIKHNVKTKNRFFCDVSELAEIIQNYQVEDLKKGEQFYRARIHKNIEEGIFNNTEMGCPPTSEKATAGRANPNGIRYLYLCGDAETPLNEVRPAYFDRVDIGTFKLKSDVRILNFTQKLDMFKAFEDGEEGFEEEVKRKIVFDAISRDLSRPMNRFDTELEYVPTQFICEYFKNQGIDGVMFESSVHQKGKNLVLFNPDSAECINVVPYEVKSISIDKRKII